MPTLGIRQATWQGLRQNQRDLMRWASRKLELGRPALYETPGGVQWFVFDDARFYLLMFARLGTLANEVADLPKSWKPPTTGTGQNKVVDRAAVEAEAISRVAASIVLPENIDYEPGGIPVANPYDWTLKNQDPPAPAAMQGAGAVPATWTPVVTP